MLTLRIAVNDDAEPLAALAAATFPLACPPDVGPADIQAFLAGKLSAHSFSRYIADPDHTVILAEYDGVPAGYTLLVAGAPADPEVAASLSLAPAVELSKCYVHPDHHGRGVSGQLMMASIEWARRTAVGLWLGVNQRNARAIAFYTKNGFRTVGTKRFMVGAVQCEDFVMERGIEAPAVQPIC